MDRALPAPILTRPIRAWLFAKLAPVVRYFDKVTTGSWKAMVLAAESWPDETRFALEETPERYLVRAVVPGCRQLTVSIDEGKLRIQGKRQAEFIGGNSFGYRRERQVDEVFQLPADADHEKAVSVLRPSGVLFISIPRLPCLQVTAAPSVMSSPP